MYSEILTQKKKIINYLRINYLKSIDESRFYRRLRSASKSSRVLAKTA